MKGWVLIFILLTVNLRSQEDFYNSVMTQNVAIADTGTDAATLERSTQVFQRFGKSYAKDWIDPYYEALTLVRTADLILKKDSSFAKLKLLAAKRAMKRTDSLKKEETENNVLNWYIKVTESRLKKMDQKDRALFEKELDAAGKLYSNNPRMNTVNAYYLILYYNSDKQKQAKAKALLNTANKLFAAQKTEPYYPSWGKKWTQELLKKIATTVQGKSK